MRHPIHPALVHFPIALWTASLVWDGVALLLADAFWWRMSFWSILAGLVMSVPAIVTGLIEYMRLEDGHPALRTANLHVAAVSLATLLFLVSLLARGGEGTPGRVALLVALASSALGFLSLLVGGWHASELVYRFGVGAPRGSTGDG